MDDDGLPFNCSFLVPSIIDVRVRYELSLATCSSSSIKTIMRCDAARHCHHNNRCHHDSLLSVPSHHSLGWILCAGAGTIVYRRCIAAGRASLVRGRRAEVNVNHWHWTAL